MRVLVFCRAQMKEARGTPTDEAGLDALRRG